MTIGRPMMQLLEDAKREERERIISLIAGLKAQTLSLKAQFPEFSLDAQSKVEVLRLLISSLSKP